MTVYTPKRLARTSPSGHRNVGLGQRQVIPGLEEVVGQMLPGEEVQALIPAKLAYGEKGVCTDKGECLIKPGTDLKYFIKLRRVASDY